MHCACVCFSSYKYFLLYLFQAYTNATSNIFPQSFWTANKAFSPSNSFIQITASGKAARNELSVGDTAQVHIRTTQEVPSIRILVSIL